MQLLKLNIQTFYKVVELDILTDNFNELYRFSVEPRNWMNGAAYNPVDGIVYGQFQYASGNPRVLCRFNHQVNSQACFCESGNTALFAGTFTADGHYYLSAGGSSILKLANAANLVASSLLSACPTTTILASKVRSA